MFDAFVTLQVFFFCTKSFVEVFVFRIMEAFEVAFYIIFVIPIMILQNELLAIQETRELGQDWLMEISFEYRACHFG